MTKPSNDHMNDRLRKLVQPIANGSAGALLQSKLAGTKAPIPVVRRDDVISEIKSVHTAGGYRISPKTGIPK